MNILVHLGLAFLAVISLLALGLAVLGASASGHAAGLEEERDRREMPR